MYYSPLLRLIIKWKRSDIMFKRSMSLSISIYFMQNIAMSTSSIRILPYALFARNSIRIDLQLYEPHPHAIEFTQTIQSNCLSSGSSLTKKHVKTFVSIIFNRITDRPTLSPRKRFFFIEMNDWKLQQIVCICTMNWIRFQFLNDWWVSEWMWMISFSKF